MAKWQTTSSEEVYRTPWMKVRRDEVVNHNGKPITYSVAEIHHPAVYIVPMDSDGNILLQMQYRYTLNKEVWEIPAGHSDGDDLLTAAKRELREETGLVSNDWIRLGEEFSAVGVANFPGVMYLARDVQPTDAARDEDEEILEQKFFTPQQVKAMLLSNEIQVASVIGSLSLALLHLESTKEDHHA
jgi:8-oxo-dGTP pyrophosphatase MutT (NUDIX family)